MSESDPKTGSPTLPESQKQRWVKYGANVALSSLVLIAIAVLIIYIVQEHAGRIDTTLGHAESLSPQTVDFIQKNDQKVQIIALYPKVKIHADEQDLYTPVADLLDDYAAHGKDISTQMLDPDTERDQFAKLVSDVTNRYGGEVKGYKAILDNLQGKSDQISRFASDEAARYRNLPIDQVADANLQQNLAVAYPTILAIPRQLKDLRSDVDADLDQQIPSYKEGVDEVQQTYSGISQELDLFAGLLESVKKTAGVPRAIQDYVPGAQARAAAIKKIADGVLDDIQHLGTLKELNDFKDQLKTRSILIMTAGGYKILSFDQCWKEPPQSQFSVGSSDAPPRLVFAGEQQITSAIASLTGPPRPMIVFVRPGGEPLTTIDMQGQAGPFAAVAQRLKDYNFDVEEKDASGQYAMQAQGMAPPEPTDEQMKSAVWVVLRAPRDTINGPSAINDMLRSHLEEGGSAMVLLFPMAEPMTDVLAPYGIEPRTDFVVVHEALPAPARRSTDPVEVAEQAGQLFFKLDNYGDGPIAKPLQGLDFLTEATAPIAAIEGNGVTTWPLLPIPQSPHAWASADVSTIFGNSTGKIIFNPRPDPDAGRPVGDIDNTPANPLYGAMSAEKGKTRLVVVGSYLFAISDFVNLPDAEMFERHGLPVARLPGNGEFFVDSILWLSHLDSMLAISPHALQMARIREMSPATLAFWRVGVMTAGLPLAVVVAGLLVYVKRRD